MNDLDSRKEFLLRMYDQMYDEINRSILSVWQLLAAIVGVSAVYMQYTRFPFQTDVSTCLALVIVTWLIAHIIDSNYWYNRNNAIISNIERQFLINDDLRNIHFYFGSHRDGKIILTNFKIQLYAVIGISSFVVLYHVVIRLMPFVVNRLWAKPEYWFEFKNYCIFLPYLVMVTGVVCLIGFKRKRNGDYELFTSNSPGVYVNTENITYGKGHPIDPKSRHNFFFSPHYRTKS